MLTCTVTKGTTNLDGTFRVSIDERECTCWVTAYTTIPDVVSVRCPEQQESAANCQPSSLGQSRNLHYEFQPVHIKAGGDGSGNSFNYGELVLPASTAVAESASVADTILTGWMYVKSHSGVSIPEVSVEYPCGMFCTQGVYFDPHTMGDLYVQPNIDAQTILDGYCHFVLWYHTSNLSEEKLSSLLDESLRPEKTVANQEIAL